MATFSGNLVPTSIQTEQPDNPDFGQLVEPDYTLTWLATHMLSGSYSDEIEIGQPADAHSGTILETFGFLNWYNHIHVEPLSIDLGNLISVQVRTISVWNGFFVPRTLNDVVPANDEGLILTEPAPTPLVFAPLQQLDYELQVSTDGPPIVDATYDFEFDIATFVVSVTGVRIVAWQWEANWITPVIERFAFNTDIIPAYDGSEQRRELREFPRGGWEFTFDVADATRRLYENVVYAWGARVWALPIWPDIQQLADPLLAGSSFVPIDDTTGRDWHEEGLGVILSVDGTTYESFEVLTVAANGVNLVNPISQNWPAGSRVYPARTARLEDPRSTGRFHRNYARGLARFTTVEEIEHDALSETLYRGEPVMEREPNWRDAPEIDYMRKLATLGFDYGKEVITDEADLALPRHAVRWTMLDRDEANYFRDWLYARKGRCKGIWLPTWCDDLVLAVLVTDTQLNIDVQACGLKNFAAGDVHRRDIRIELYTGTIFYRRVSGFVIVDANTERMTMNASFGQQVTPEQVRRISWMHYVRLDADAIELAWSTPAHAEAVLVFKGPRNDF